MRGNPDWDAIFDGYASTTDYPACTYWRELADHYPQAKVILSTRDADSWFASVHKTILSPESVARFSEGPLAEFMHGAILDPFGERINDAVFMADWFRHWEASVIEALPPERLLVHRSSDGWEPLCAFLDVPVPTEPYPRVNSSEDMLASGGPSRVASNPEEGARGYMDAMKNKAFGS